MNNMNNINNIDIDIDIDIVYTYVSYRDKKWQEKYLQYSTDKKNVRYYSLNELELSVKHTIKYCKFVRNIYIITDNQIPYWYTNDIYKNVFIIDHKTIFDEDCIYPNYNSNTIECYIDNIPNLSEIFLYLNDDFFINIKKSDLFNNNGIPYSFFKTKNWDFDLNDAKIKYRKKPASLALYNTIKLAEKYFKKKFNISYIHQAYILSKSACKLTKKIFDYEIKKKVKMRFREFLSENDLVYPLLCNIVSTEKNITKLKLFNNTKLNRFFINLNLENVHRINDILTNDYNFFCINDIKLNKKLIDEYYKFSNNFRKKISNTKNMINISINDILLINLDKSKDRLNRFNDNLFDNNFNIIRIPAFDANNISDNNFKILKKNKNKFLGLSDTKKGQYGCWKSHIKCYKYIIDNFIEWAIIMEDDALLKPGLSKIFKNFSIPNDTDIIFIHKRSQKCKRIINNFKNFDICVDGWGSDGYIISYNCAKKILDSVYSNIYFMQIDTILFQSGKNYTNKFRSEYRHNLFKKNIKIKNIVFSIYFTKNNLLDEMLDLKKKTTVGH